MKYKIKYCNNDWCLENAKQKGDIVGILKIEKKDIQICIYRKYCPDGKWHYFDYKPNLIMLN